MQSLLTKAVVGAVALAAVAAGTAAYAHHAIQAQFDTNKVVPMTGKLTKVDWINPHVWFHFRMTEPNGVIVMEVPIEWLGLAAIRRAGVYGPGAFTVGQTYKVTYNPNRDGSFGGEIVSLMDQTGHVFSDTAWQGRASAGQLPPPSAPPVLGIGH